MVVVYDACGRQIVWLELCNCILWSVKSVSQLRVMRLLSRSSQFPAMPLLRLCSALPCVEPKAARSAIRIVFAIGYCSTECVMVTYANSWFD